MFNRDLENTLNHAFSQARDKRHEFITVEHLLLGLLFDKEVSKVLSACGANLERLKAGLGIFVDETTPQIPISINRDLQPTMSFQRVLQRAIYQVQTGGLSEVAGINVLTAIFSESESQAVYFLNQENITRIDVMNYISHGIEKTPGSFGRKERDTPTLDTSTIQDSQPDSNIVENYT